MRSNQIEEQLGIEKAHMLEFQHFTMVWDRKMNEYEMNAHKLVEVRMFKMCHSFFVEDNIVRKQCSTILYCTVLYCSVLYCTVL